MHVSGRKGSAFVLIYAKKICIYLVWRVWRSESEWYSNDLLRCADEMDEAYPLQEALKSRSEFNSNAMDKAYPLQEALGSLSEFNSDAMDKAPMMEGKHVLHRRLRGAGLNQIQTKWTKKCRLAIGGIQRKKNASLTTRVLNKEETSWRV